MRFLITVPILGLLITGNALGQKPVTYIDADTTLAGGTDSGDTDVALALLPQNEWVVRDVGVGGDLLQFRDTDGTDPPTPDVLSTVIAETGLAPNTAYNIYAFFWDDASDTEWFIDAGLNVTDFGDASQFNNFTQSNINGFDGPVFEAATLPITNLDEINGTTDLTSVVGVTSTISLTPGVDGNDQTRSDGVGEGTDLLAALLGSVTTNGAGALNAVVGVRNNSAGNRVWYDGVGFQEAGVIGDSNGDGFVNGLDFDQIAAGFLGPDVTPGADNTGDVFGDGVIDLRDFSVWQQTRSQGTVASATGVPEPAGVALIALAAACRLARRPRGGARR